MLAGYIKELKSRLLTKSTILLLFYLFAVKTITIVAKNVSLELPTSWKRNKLDGWLCLSADDDNPIAKDVANLYSYGLYILIPLAGWISDAKLGRTYAMKLSLLSGWLAALLAAVASCIQYACCGYHNKVIFSITEYAISPLALLLCTVSVSFCYANIFGLAVSQFLLAGAGSVKIRAFIRWALWFLFASGNCTYMMNDIKSDNQYSSNVSISAFSFTTLSLCLCLHFWFHHWFEEMHVEDSYMLSFRVLKYAWNHKYPVNRSALTYWQNETPGRIDFGKRKYGGPFSDESVEMVKTFLRILVVVLALIPYMLAANLIINEIPQFAAHYKDVNGSRFHANITWFIGDDLILILIPLLELVILPLFPKLEYFLINPLRGIGLSIIFLIASAATVSVIDIIGFHSATPHEDITCFISKYDYKISYWIMLIPSVLAGLADMLNKLYVLAFLCSQAPSSMSGTLIGIFFFLRGICIQICALMLMETEQHRWLDRIRSTNHNISCDSVPMFALIIVTVPGLILYLLAAKWYKNRIRNEDLNLRVTIERHYEKKLLTNDSTSSQSYDTTSVRSVEHYTSVN